MEIHKQIKIIKVISRYRQEIIHDPKIYTHHDHVLKAHHAKKKIKKQVK